MKGLKKIDPEVFHLIQKEIKRESETLELIASENFVSPAVLEAQGSVLTNKYAEGYPRRRWYGGCQYVDAIEFLAIERAKKLFKAEHANVQPHSGTQANMAVYFALLEPGETVLAMDLACGGHLSHGHPHSFSGRFYHIVTYGVDRKTELIDYDQIDFLAKKYHPKIILAGASAYSRIIDFKKLREICDKVKAYLFVDMAHFAGLVAAGLHPNPCEYAEIVTTTTHKTLRGARGGVILCRKEFSRKIDAQIFPGIQGGPLLHIIAAKAVTFKEAMSKEFEKYQRQVVKNAQALASALEKKGLRIVSGGTDTHLFLVDLLKSRGITGKEASEILERAGITVNKNLIPFDSLSPAITSGIRLGTPAVTTRGMKEKEMKEIAAFIDELLKATIEEESIKKIKYEVKDLLKKFPLY
ncbi:MAG: serine hydroxymethyltransferase [Candidatus Omnitrophica bacterium]|nr:serine hydroxymethyltransferase [Candidatus Omnitrophota bacterium]MCM8793506.1 serine hydroxymethyltransferase [Candidatus Omnitrophota bacterium]